MTAPVEGKITYKGQTIKGGTILFVHPLGLPYPAEISSEGTFQTVVGVGLCKVAIEYREEGKIPKDGKEGLVPPGKSLLPEKYTSHSTSGLTFDVKPGSNVANFDL